MSYVYLTVEHLLLLHVRAINDFGGSMGIRDIGRLESAVASQYQTIFNEEIYPTIFDKSAALIRGIIADHPFVDGNKRTAMLAGIVLVEINGYLFAAKKGILEDFAVKVATDHLSVEQIAKWLKDNSKKCLK